MSMDTVYFSTVSIFNSTQNMNTSEMVNIDYLTNAIRWYNRFVVIPVVCSIGIIGNVISIVVIIKSGLRRPSNIFLFGLAVADTMALIHIFDVSEYFKMRNSYCAYYECNLLFFPYAPALTILVFKIVFFFMSALGGRLSTVITVVITVERLIAVFNPLKLTRIVTRRRAWLVLFFSVMFWLPWSIFQLFWFKLNFEYSERYESFVAWDSSSDYYNSASFDVVWFHDEVITHPTHTIPLVIVAIGSLAIGFKLQTIALKRQKIVSSTSIKRSTSKTTKTLLMVCIIYSITRFCFVIRTIPWLNTDDPALFKVYLFYDIIRYLFVDVNSSCNFFIYVAVNPKFRHVFENLFSRRQINVESESICA